MPDQYEKDLMTCVHCGICLNACPTYLETGSEADSPRGRIVLMRGMHDGTLSPADPDVVRHIDLCLGCRACETACPSKVPYGNLLELARERINDAGVRSAGTALSRRALLATMTNPPAMAITMQASQMLPGGQANVPAFAMRLLSADPAAAGQPKPLPDVISPPLPPAFTPAVGEKRYRVAVLTGCVMRVLYGDVNADTVRVLAANGCEVLVNRRQACCGALHLHNGYGDEARSMARRLIDAFTPFDGLDAIVVNSAGCASTMKEYGPLLASDAAYATRAEAFAGKVRDVSEYLDGIGWIAPLTPLPQPLSPPGKGEPDAGDIVVAYHDACHLAHAQQIRQQPRRLLAKIPGVKLVPLIESEICCGSAGIYNLTEPDMANRLQARKVDNVLKTGASIVVSGNPGCLAWIEAGLQQRGITPPLVMHPVTLLAAALKEV
jgi:glycolate oxidase iron-sulfur subunit